MSVGGALHRPHRAGAMARATTTDVMPFSKKWKDGFGDWRQELVFIGQGIDVPRLHRDLDIVEQRDCLAPDAWTELNGAATFDTRLCRTSLSERMHKR
ncbi:hypothetical protein E1J61_30105 [Cupriavidus sp. L7L]|nr:hypothetical protein E1J61_30105 [Cupriavidus sp. L7L]